MKRRLFAVLLAFCLIAGSALNVCAADGPNENAGNYSYIQFAKVLNEAPYWDTVCVLFSGSGEELLPQSGAEYDKETNTITLTDYNHPDVHLSTNEMGDDLKLKLVGENHLASITVWGYGYGGNLSIIGDGSIVINEERTSPYGAVRMMAEDTQGILKIGSDVTFEAYKSSEDVDPLVYDGTVGFFSCRTARNPFVIEGILESELQMTEDSGKEIEYEKTTLTTKEGDYDAVTLDCATKEGDEKLYGLEKISYTDYIDDTLQDVSKWQIYELVPCEGLPSGNSHLACLVTTTEDDTWPAEYVKTGEEVTAKKEDWSYGQFRSVIKDTVTGETFVWGSDEIVYPPEGGWGTAYYSVYKILKTYTRTHYYYGEIECAVIAPVEGLRNLTDDISMLPDGYEFETRPSGTYNFTYINDIIKVTPNITSDSDTETVSDTDVQSDTDSDTETVSDSDVQSDTESDTESDTDTEPETVTCKYGDVNNDGRISALDSFILQRYVAGAVELADYQRILGDVTDDGTITAKDYVDIQRYSAKGISNYKTGEAVEIPAELIELIK